MREALIYYFTRDFYRRLADSLLYPLFHTNSPLLYRYTLTSYISSLIAHAVLRRECDNLFFFMLRNVSTIFKRHSSRTLSTRRVLVESIEIACSHWLIAQGLPYIYYSAARVVLLLLLLPLLPCSTLPTSSMASV